ncbi:hypothetical protein B296_00004323 [Ensete ventricosum]|uniref:Uncharacterized protein n=1 Tax=Ensete ventricosum TaxID=4639 RepID=A0A426ZK74_ENSVE|nr:hypothetical protein B296_00004323 [Ensete ventricosum]
MEESLPAVIELAPTSRQGLLVGAEASQWPTPIYTVGPKLGVMIQLLSLLQGHSVEEAKGASEKEKNQAFEWEKRLVASYKESEGFQYGLRCFSQVPYVLGYKIIIGCFKVWFP